MTAQFAADHAAVEQQRVQRQAGKTQAQAVEHRDHRHRLHLDAGLLVDLLDRDLARRVSDVGVPDGVEPHTGVGPLGEEELAALVGDDGGDGDLGRHVPLHALAHAAEPFVEQRVALGLFDRDVADVGRHLQHLLEALLLVEALGEAEAGAGHGGERLGPAEEVDGGRTEGLGHGGETNPRAHHAGRASPPR